LATPVYAVLESIFWGYPLPNYVAEPRLKNSELKYESKKCGVTRQLSNLATSRLLSLDGKSLSFKTSIKAMANIT